MTGRLLLVAASLLALPARGAEADWPSFRGSPAMTGVAKSALPAKPQRLWRHEAGAGVTSTAAIVGDRVFVGTDGGKVLCLDGG